MNLEGMQGQGATESCSCTVGGVRCSRAPLGAVGFPGCWFLDSVRWYNVREVESRWARKTTTLDGPGWQCPKIIEAHKREAERERVLWCNVGH